VADPRGLIRPWPPSVLAIEFGPTLAKEKMIIKDKTGGKTKEKW